MFDCTEILDNLSDGLYTVTRYRKITTWNKAAEQITGYSADEILNSYCHQGVLKHIDAEGNDLCSQGCPLDRAMAQRCPLEEDIFLHHKGGHRIPVRVKISPTYDSDGNVVGAIELFSENRPKGVIAERIAQLEDLAMLDPLTRLANTAYIHQQIDNFLQTLQRHPLRVGALLVEIDASDTLRTTNEISGWDSLQQAIAETLRSNSRPLDLFGRLEEGLYLGLIQNVTSNQLNTVAEQLRCLCEKSNQLCEAGQHSCTVSIGGAVLRRDDDRRSLLHRITGELRKAQNAGGNRSSIEVRFTSAQR